MIQLKFIFTLILSTITLISCKTKNDLGKDILIFEAENMDLTNYEIDNDDSRTFIKLTDSTGTAKFNFSLPTGRYDIDASYLSESVGQNTYTLYIGDNQIVAWLGKNRDDKWHMLSEQKWHVPKNIPINQGDEIRIEGLSETGSLVTLDYIEFTTSERQRSSLQIPAIFDIDPLGFHG